LRLILSYRRRLPSVERQTIALALALIAQGPVAQARGATSITGDGQLFIGWIRIDDAAQNRSPNLQNVVTGVVKTGFLGFLGRFVRDLSL
jgi:hypothetical protein